MRTSMSHGMQVLCRLMHVVCSSAERLRFCKAAAGAHLKSSVLYLLLGIPAVILVLGFIAYLTLPYHISAGIWASVFDNNSVVVLESNLAADGSNILILKDINAGGGYDRLYEQPRAPADGAVGFTNPHAEANYVHLLTSLRWREFHLTFVAQKSGQVTVALGCERHIADSGEFNALTDYKSVWLNGKKYLGDKTTVNWRKPFRIKLKVAAGKTYKLSFKSRRHFPVWADMGTNFRCAPDYLMLGGAILLIALTIGRLWLQRQANDSAQFSASQASQIPYPRPSDIFLVAVLGVLLAVTALKWTDAEKSTFDRRKLGLQPSLYQKETVNLRFGRQMEKWFTDRFNLRVPYMQMYFCLEAMVDAYPHIWDRVFNPEHGWFMFFHDKPEREDEEVKAAVDSLKKLEALLQKRGIKFYALLIPVQQDIYPYQHPYLNADFHQAYHRKLAAALMENLQSPVIYPLQAMRAASRSEYVFYKTDHHLTDWGAYAVYQKLLLALRGDFPQVSAVSWDDLPQVKSRLVRSEWDQVFHNGDSARTLHVASTTSTDHLDTIYSHMFPLTPGIDYAVDILADGRRLKHWRNSAHPKLKILSFGDSQNENLNHFLPYSSSELMFARLNLTLLPFYGGREHWKFLKHYADLLDSYQPDAVLMTMYLNDPYFFFGQIAAKK